MRTYIIVKQIKICVDVYTYSEFLYQINNLFHFVNFPKDIILHEHKLMYPLYHIIRMC